MYMRVARSRVDPSRVDEVSQLGLDVVAAIRRLPGCQSATIGINRGTGEEVLVSTWDTEEHARFTRDALGDILSRVQSFGGQLDPPEFFELMS
jgi:quinol monooxygenase YgiN